MPSELDTDDDLSMDELTTLDALERDECVPFPGWRDRLAVLIALERLPPRAPLPAARVETPEEELERLSYRVLELAGECRRRRGRRDAQPITHA
jgi:hypothetical protein